MGLFGDMLKGLGKALSEVGSSPNVWYNLGLTAGKENKPRESYKFRSQGVSKELCDAWDKGYDDGQRQRS